MTRRSITSILGSLLVGLTLITTNAPSVAAEELIGGGSTRPPAVAESHCDDEMLCLSMYLPAAGPAAVSVASAGQPVTARECTHPTIGFPTCYASQDDGTWAREELADTDGVWVIVGTVTFDEMRAAVGVADASTA
jgi:hypothetical protein